MRQKNKNGPSKKGEKHSGGGWEVVYSGFILIMLCFFIMLSSFSTMEEAKIMRFVRSFANAISILPGGLKFDSSTAVMLSSADMVESRSELAKVNAELKSIAGGLDLENDIAISMSPEGLVMQLPDTVLFDLGVAEISSKAIPLLKKVGAIIAKIPYEVRIEGHTDDLPIKTEQFPSNWELSTARAVNVLRHFADSCSIPSERLSAVGFGEFQPVVANDSPDHRAKNRRVEIIFLDPDRGKPTTGTGP